MNRTAIQETIQKSKRERAWLCTLTGIVVTCGASVARQTLYVAGKIVERAVLILMELNQFVNFVFDHDVCKPSWFKGDKIARVLMLAIDSLEVTTLIAETFEQPNVLLQPFSDSQVAQGLEFCRYHNLIWRPMRDDAVPQHARMRTIRSFASLFRQVMAARCPNQMVRMHSSENENPLNTFCYMWWDGTERLERPKDPNIIDIDQEKLNTMSEILGIPHCACQESALHGLSHWHYCYPDRVEEIINNFLNNDENISGEIRIFASYALKGSLN